eukprot:scaffold56770_cov34-Cyclotella_meneghiniana.AAC.2
MDLLKNVTTIGTKASATKGATLGDIPLDRNEDKVKQLLKAKIVAPFKDDDELFATRTPVAHPIKGGIERLCKGEAGDETVEDALKAWGGEAATNWLFSIQQWDEDVQTALLTDDDLKKYLPKSK